MTNNIFLLTYLMVYLPIIIIFCLMPYITRKNIFFGVNAPVSFADSDTARAMKKSYVSRIIMISIIIILFSLMTEYFFDEKYKPIIMVISIFLLIAIVSLFYINMWKKAKRLSVELEWHKQMTPVMVTDTSFYSGKITVSSYWFILYGLLIAVTIALGIIFYDKIPEKVLMQTNLNGAARYAAKSYQLMLYIPMVQLFLTGTFMLVQYSIKRARPELNPQDIKESVEQNIKFRYYWSSFSMCLGIVLLSIFMLTQLGMITLIQQEVVIYATYAVLGVTLISVIALAIITGQSGSRLKVGQHDIVSGKVKSDDDNWKFGMIYVNRNDPSLFVEKRFGVGFTLNFARPISWIVIAIIVIIIIGAIIIGGK